MKRSTVLMLAWALVIVACGGVGEPSDFPERSDSTGREGTANDTLIGCPSGPWFPRAALEEQVDLASSGREDIVEAMRPFLESEEGNFWPQEGWQILHDSDDQVLVVHLEPPDGLSFMTIEKTGGTWKWAGAQMGGPCPLVVQVPDGLNTIDWRLQPGESPTPETTSVTLLLLERECVSGQEIGGRLVGPEVVYTDEEVLVSFSAQPPPGEAFTCQGNPETPFLLELEEPLGQRRLTDGRDLGINLEEVIG